MNAIVVAAVGGSLFTVSLSLEVTALHWAHAVLWALRRLRRIGGTSTTTTEHSSGETATVQARVQGTDERRDPPPGSGIRGITDADEA
jgi:hypothetical protein